MRYFASSCITALLCVVSGYSVADVSRPVLTMEYSCNSLKLKTFKWGYFSRVNPYSHINYRSLSTDDQIAAMFKGMEADRKLKDDIKLIYIKQLSEIGINMIDIGIPKKGEGAINFEITSSYIGSSPTDKNDYSINQSLVFYEHVLSDNGYNKWLESFRINASDLTTVQWFQEVAENQIAQIVSEYAKLRLKAHTQCK